MGFGDGVPVGVPPGIGDPVGVTEGVTVGDGTAVWVGVGETKIIVKKAALCIVHVSPGIVNVILMVITLLISVALALMGI